MPWDSLPCTAVFASSASLVSLEVLMAKTAAFGAEFRAAWGSFPPAKLNVVCLVRIWCPFWHLAPICHILASGRGRQVSASESVCCHSRLNRLIAIYVRSCYLLPLFAEVASGAGSAASQWVPDLEPWRNHMGKWCVWVPSERCQVHLEGQPDPSAAADCEDYTTCNGNVPPLCLLIAVEPKIPVPRSRMDLGFEPEEYPRGTLSLSDNLLEREILSTAGESFCAMRVYCHAKLKRCIQTYNRSCSVCRGRAGHRGWLSAYLAESCFGSLEVQHVQCTPIHSLRHSWR